LFDIRIMYSFERLVVWQKATTLIGHIYKLCNKLPSNEERNLIDQIKRATTSISLNIAEGSGAESSAEYRRFLFMARKSLYEVVALLKIIESLYPRKTGDILVRVDEIGKLLNGLINSQKD